MQNNNMQFVTIADDKIWHGTSAIDRSSDSALHNPDADARISTVGVTWIPLHLESGVFF
jgi:hypothetical protein